MAEVIHIKPFLLRKKAHEALSILRKYDLATANEWVAKNVDKKDWDTLEEIIKEIMERDRRV